MVEEYFGRFLGITWLERISQKPFVEYILGFSGSFISDLTNFPRTSQSHSNNFLQKYVAMQKSINKQLFFPKNLIHFKPQSKYSAMSNSSSVYRSSVVLSTKVKLLDIVYHGEPSQMESPQTADSQRTGQSPEQPKGIHKSFRPGKIKSSESLF